MSRAGISRRFSMTVLATAASLIAGQFAAPSAAAERQLPPQVQAAAAPTDYAYDATGRLAGVTQAAGTAKYGYDANGNVTSVGRTAAGIAVLSVVPARAAEGATVTISGTGFEPVTSANTVTFNGTTAQVVAATPTRLTVGVPAGATTGTLTVTTASGTASAEQPFTVDPAVSPVSVTGFSPATVATGDQLTVTGTGFSPNTAENIVTIGRTRARVTAASATSLTATVPDAVSSGRVSVAVNGSDATSAADLTVAPRGYAPDVIATNNVLAVDGASVTVTIPASKVALLRFSAVRGQRLSLGFSASTISTAYGAALFNPYGASFGRDIYDAPRTAFEGGYDLPPIAISGTYQLIVDPDAAGTGSVTVTLSSQLTGALSLTGAGTQFTFSRPGQMAALTMSAQAGQYIGFGVTGSTFAAGSKLVFTIREPNGAYVLNGQYARTTFNADGSNDYGFVAAQAGTYTLSIGSYEGRSGRATVTASPYLDAGAAIVGTAKNFSVTRPGQTIRMTYAGTINQELNLDLSNWTFKYTPYVRVLAPDGSLAYTVNGEYHLDLGPLAATGTYTILISTFSSTGGGTLKLTAKSAATTISATGPTVSVQLTAAGQTKTLSFSGTANKAYTFGFGQWGMPTGSQVHVRLLNSGSTVLAEYDVGALGIFWYTPTASATYRLQVSAKNGTDTGSVAVTMSTEIAGGTLTPATQVTVTAARPAQPTRYSFTGAVGQRLSLAFASYAFQYGFYLQVLKPDGTVLRQHNLAYTQVDMDPLPVAGTYQLVIRPYAETGSTKLTLVQRGDAGTTSVGGAAKPVAISAGQYGETSFTATANQPLDFGFAGWTFAAGTQLRTRLLNPSGTEVVDTTISSGSSFHITAPTAGTYRLVIAPVPAVAGSVSVTISQQVDAGSIALGTPKTVTFSRVGNSARMTFTGTAGQYLAIKASDVTGAPVAYARAFRPDGNVLVNWSQINGVGALPQLPATGTYTLHVTLASYTGSATFTLYDLGAQSSAAQPKAAHAGPVGTPSPALKSPQLAVGGPIAKRPVGQVVAPPQPPAGTESWTPDKRNLSGGAWVTNRPPLPGPAPAALQAPKGTTALAGRLLTLDGKPLAGVTTGIGSVKATSDRLGRFLLAGIPAGHAVLRVDGASASSATRKFGLFDIGVDIAAGRTTALAYPIWMSTLDTRHTVRFASPAASEVVVRTPAIPGLEVRLPKGAVVRDVSGKPVTELGITAIPVDRPPFPLPKSQVPVYFTVQPGSSYVFPTGARVIYPNYTRAAPGATMDFWHYDPAGRGWFVYGHGKVTANGQQVVPDAGTEVYQFTGAMLISPGVDAPPRVAPLPGNDFQGGDPVDLATGVLATSQTDLAVTDTLPIGVTRTYQHADAGRRDFGVGTTSAYGMYLYANQQWLDGQLILPGGEKITYHRVSAGGTGGTGGADYSSSAMLADPTPSEYAGSVLVWGDDGFEVRLRDGTTYVFGNEAPLRAIRDQFGNQITITRAPAPADPDGHIRPKGPITQVTSPNGKWIRFGYDAANRITGAEDITGRKVSYTYDAAGHLATATNPTGGVTSYTYDANGWLATAKNPRGVTYLTNAYDANGRVSKQTLADGGTYQYSYLTDAAGRVTETRVTDPRGTIRRITFNAQGFGLTDTRAYGTALAQTTTIARDTANRPLSITDQLGRRTDLTYDANGSLASQTQLAGTADARTESFVSGGPYGELTKHTDALGRVTTYTYAADGAPRTITDPASRVTTVNTNAAGQPTTVTDPLNHTTTYGYVAGELANVTDPLGRVTRQRLDGTGRRTAHIDPLGAVSTIGYDAADRPLTTTDPLGRVTTYGYDPNGNLTAVTDPLSHKTTFTYDNLDRPTATTDPLNRSRAASYDAAGHLAVATSAAGNRSEYAYDPLGRMTTAKFGVTASGAQNQVTYAYDGGNRLTSITDSAAGTTTLTPDGFDRITRISSPQGQLDYTFDAADQRTSLTVSGQPATSYGYAADGALASVKRGSDQVTLAYDGAGRRAALTLPDGITQQYAYDAGGQLSGIDYRLGGASIGDLTYTYDPRGLVSHVGGSFARSTLPAASGPTTYDAADQRTDYQYDADGNLLSDGITSYTWNARGQLASSTRGGQNTGYRYDGLGRRVGKGTTSYLFDGVTAIQEADGTVTASMLTGGVDEVFSRTSGGTTRSLLTDRLGSTVAVGDPAGALTGEYTYTPYGQTSLDGQDGGNPTRFTGREDEGNGLYYYRARYYSSTDQRFLSHDPLGFAAGDSNLYAYVQGQPTRFTDPTGMLPLDTPELPKRIYLGDGRWLNKATGNIEDQAGFVLGSGNGGGSPAGARPEAEPPAYPPIKPGSANGPTAGKPFPESVRKDVLDENPDTCVYCHMTTDRPQVDHAIPRSRGGDATLDNGQTTCPHCNASKRDRDFPVNPPPGYEGEWPPPWWH